MADVKQECNSFERSKMPDCPRQDGIKLKDLCDHLSINYDEARYTLARGVLPKAIAKTEPGRGNHRVFNPEQAFYLAVCLKLKAAGVNTTLAAKISDWSRSIQNMSQNLGWDFQFAPFAGMLNTEHEWYIDVGDARYVRLATNANPSRLGLDILPWTDMASRKECKTSQPAVIFRVDIGLIAGQLQASVDVQKMPSKT